MRARAKSSYKQMLLKGLNGQKLARLSEVSDSEISRILGGQVAARAGERLPAGEGRRRLARLPRRRQPGCRPASSRGRDRPGSRDPRAGSARSGIASRPAAPGNRSIPRLRDWRCRACWERPKPIIEVASRAGHAAHDGLAVSSAIVLGDDPPDARPRRRPTGRARSRRVKSRRVRLRTACAGGSTGCGGPCGTSSPSGGRRGSRAARAPRRSPRRRAGSACLPWR